MKPSLHLGIHLQSMPASVAYRNGYRGDPTESARPGFYPVHHRFHPLIEISFRSRQEHAITGFGIRGKSLAAITVVSICFLCVFLIRDAQLVSAGPFPALHWRLGFYWVVIFSCVLAARDLDVGRPAEIITALRSPLVWGVSVGLHVACLSICLWLRRLQRSDWGWLVGLFPTPMLILLLLGATGAVAPGMANRLQLWTCVLVALGWTLIVGLAGKLNVLIGGSDSEFAVNFAAASNSTVLALFPFSPFF